MLQGRLFWNIWKEIQMCNICKDILWVCETHPYKPCDIDGEIEGRCECGAPGIPCECNPCALLPPGARVICEREKNICEA